jgi:polyribonucleotide nucleotidyltransferase
MATVCATALALMDAGVPIKDVVGGVAMGLIKNSSQFYTLTDILGVEDAYGIMDFKVTGTHAGIMAIQMDVKDPSGITKQVLSQALEQAKKARIYIIDEMKNVLDAPRATVSELAPQVEIFKISADKIGVVIGPAGKMIKEIIAKTNVQIDIEEDGTVKIYSKKSEDAKAAVSWVKVLAGQIEVGSIFEGIIKRVADFGLLVELVPGKDGLVHISMISRDRQRDLSRKVKPGDVLTVKVMAYDKETDRIRLVAPQLKKPLSRRDDE